jgi:hypothetical protein
MAVTRIQNNQITDKTITYAKLADNTLTGGQFNANLTLNSNITIVGNLSVSGNTTTLNSTNTYVNDPLIIFNNGYVGSITGYDIGMVVNRNLGSLSSYGSVNTAWVWSEQDGAFIAIATTDTGAGITSINNSGFVNVKLGNLTANSITLTSPGTITAPGGIQNTPIGNATPNTGAFTYLVATTGFSTANAQITNGTISVATLTGATVNSTTANVTNLTATNLYAANAVIAGSTTYIGTGGTNIANIYVGTAYAGNFSTPNSVVTTGAVTNLTATNFYTANSRIAGGYIQGLANVTAATAYLVQVNTNGANVSGPLFATSINSANAVITGGSVNGTIIGNTTTAAANVTTLNASGTVNFTNTTAAISSGSGALQVAGGIGVAKDSFFGANVNIAGNLTVTGNSVSISSASLSIQDPIINLHSPTDLAPLTVNDNADIGLKLHYYDTVDSAAFIGRANDTGYLEWYSRGSDVGNVFTGGTYGTIKSGAMWVANTTAATGTTSGTAGALYVAGGAGIAGALYVGGALNAASASFSSINGTPIGNATPSSATFTTLTATGVTVAGGNLVANSGTASSSTTTGAIVIAGSGGLGVGGAVNIGGNFTLSGVATLSGNLVLATTTKTNDNTTGALVVTGVGGIAVGGNVNAGSQVFIGSNSQSSPIAYNALVAARGTSLSGAGTQYTQVGIINATNTGSSDFAAYPNNTITDLSHGWVDMGITGDAFNDINFTITKPNDGYVFSSGANTAVGGNLVLATDNSGGYNDIVFAAGGFVTGAEVARFHGNANNSGTFVVKLPTNAAPAANTGAFQVWGGASFSSNTYHGGATVFNGSNTAGNDFIVKGATNNTLLWARPSATYDQVLIGNSATASTLVTGAKLQINSTDAILLPVGTQAQRPGTSGYGTATAGMLRYNADTGFLEWYNGSAWQTAQTNVITIAVDQQFSGNGVQTVWGLSNSTTTAGTVISINGVVQIPTLAYSISGGTVLTFTEAPAVGDVIDVRILTTTQTVTSLSSTNGAMTISTDNNGVYVGTGTGSSVTTTSWNTAGAEVWSVANVSVASSATLTQIDSFSGSTYRSAQYNVQVTNGTSNYQVFDALLIHNGTTANLVVLNSSTVGSSTGALTATFSAGSAVLNFTAANAGNQVRVRKVYQTI